MRDGAEQGFSMVELSRRGFLSLLGGLAASALVGCAQQGQQSPDSAAGSNVAPGPDPADSSGFAPLPEEWWHFRLDPEPYPNTYFTFPVNEDSVE